MNYGFGAYDPEPTEELTALLHIPSRFKVRKRNGIKCLLTFHR